MHNPVRNRWTNQNGEVSLPFPLKYLFVVVSVKNLQSVILFKNSNELGSLVMGS